MTLNPFRQATNVRGATGYQSRLLFKSGTVKYETGANNAEETFSTYMGPSYGDFRIRKVTDELGYTKELAYQESAISNIPNGYHKTWLTNKYNDTTMARDKAINIYIDTYREMMMNNSTEKEAHNEAMSVAKAEASRWQKILEKKYASSVEADIKRGTDAVLKAEKST